MGADIYYIVYVLHEGLLKLQKYLDCLWTALGTCCSVCAFYSRVIVALSGQSKIWAMATSPRPLISVVIQQGSKMSFHNCSFPYVTSVTLLFGCDTGLLTL